MIASPFSFFLTRTFFNTSDSDMGSDIMQMIKSEVATKDINEDGNEDAAEFKDD